jgi:SNF2 family DNA or RNA helicase
MSSLATIPGDLRQPAMLPAALADYENLCRQLRQPLDPDGSALVDAAIGVWARPGFDTLVSLPRLRFEPYPHQLRAAERALRQMRGRGILADEVGLGKTIEAGLVLSELRLRGLARRVLVLVPAGLVEQWQEELDRKFALPSEVAQGRGWAAHDTAEQPVVLASLHAARRDPLRSALTTDAWDLVVVDEAHRLKNPRSASAKLARALRSRYLLLLTATPVENRLDDLFQLTSLVRPGHLGTAAQFRSRHGGASTTVPRDLDRLRADLRTVMVRHRRSELDVLLPGRLAETRRVSPLGDEASLYAGVAERVRVEGRAAAPPRRLALRSLLRLAGSSPAAAAPALDKLGWDELAAAARRVERSAKARALLELLGRHLQRGEKVVVFTAFRHTLDDLAAIAVEAGVPVAVYHGSLPRSQKEAAIARFAADVPVLLTTEAAGEGRNLQFCHVMVNFDLPWNPMQIEQRLGRIHRIGQTSDVVLTNLVARGTVEEQILRVLESKINLFELVVGELDMILGRIGDEVDFAAFVFDAHVASRDDDEFRARLDAFGDDLAAARGDHLTARQRTDVLIAEAPRP